MDSRISFRSCMNLETIARGYLSFHFSWAVSSGFAGVVVVKLCSLGIPLKRRVKLREASTR
jgi:hypothetical protein